MRRWWIRLRNALEASGPLLAILTIWWAASHGGWVSAVFLPTPEAASLSLFNGWRDGHLAHYSAQTLTRMMLGWLLASALGVVAGACIGMSEGARAYLQPLLEFLRPLPASAVLPLAIALAGLGAGMVLFVVAFGAVWPVLLATVHGFADVHPRLTETARCLRLRRSAYLWKIGLPNAMPDILAGLRLSMTVSLMVAVVAEMLASQPGLGQAILRAARSFRGDELYAGILLLGAIGYGSNLLLALAERRLLRWQVR